VVRTFLSAAFDLNNRKTVILSPAPSPDEGCARVVRTFLSAAFDLNNRKTVILSPAHFAGRRI